MAAAQAARPYQVVVWGASGFTGKLVCEHIAKDYQGRITWAIAGRDQRKLEQVRADLVKINPACKEVPILVADAYDSAAVGKVLSQTKVVLATAGPFQKYGNTVVEQSVAQGTHYCDITGEVPWVKRSMEKHHKEAEAKGVKVVHCCGYDSVPADLGTLLVVDHCQKKLGKKVDRVYTLVGPSNGAVSGGTIASAMMTVANESFNELGDISSNAYYLAGLYGGKGTAKPAPTRPTFIEPAQSWAGPFVMEGVNGRIVQASAALATQPYGSDFKYIEMMSMGSGWSGWTWANLASFGTALLGLSFALPPTRALLTKVLPAPGQGPDEQKRTTGFWNHYMYAVTEEPSGGKPTVVKGHVGDKRDPGYWSTSRMLLEAGLCLALDQANGSRKGGVLTPASAMGMALVDRLRAAGFTWEVLEGDKAAAK
mmetsp:Transcript_3822/g.8188  ORF Transcript_3822/g.8188 Transcript_3822/m.8188 type:complete len:425 (-) Transcript_3822:281-1555(-)|eukprot:CAMPEP_0202891772 /NCGR_PEP_ID=MMETSP1392-20130828/1751_1 /ASSEMBLY_ACC=CAM_ASM_000868 /TAXON_ID=225041 /ORGANISM="Chlamydomonas chlamydogama, Strain SAG 11-48b" /LENGTH=424 /DNA_ID=CAMNT_0049575625 /DNA_START=41 /DNA_END=1315 /DNA_ORIENTATION=-